MLDLAPYDEPDRKTIIDTVGIQHMGEVEHQEYMVLTDEDEIDEHAQRFFDNLEDRYTITIEKMDLGMPGATQAVQNAKHNARKNIWWYPNREPWSNRYWNCFGVGKPDSTGPNSITVEINFPIHRADRRVSGALVRDEKGEVHVTHSGRLGGKLGRGLKFSDYYQNKSNWIEAYDGKPGKRRLIRIASINDPDLLRRVADFVKDVSAFKTNISGPVSDRRMPKIEDRMINDIISEGCFLKKERLKTILGNLKRKKNLILQGPPGTGKTWLAKRLAFVLIKSKDEDKVLHIQFHPNLSYEDFVRGYRPAGEDKLQLVDGPFLEMKEKAEEDRDTPHICVIEEINRGNPAQIFGELLTLLESDKRDKDHSLRLAYTQDKTERISLPPNLYVIGTMNLSDRSLAMMDMALRRRFAFEDLKPAFNDEWEKWIEQCGVPSQFAQRIKKGIEDLNAEISDDKSLGKQYLIGHSFFTPPKDKKIDDHKEWFASIVEREIGPLLDEYWFDNQETAKGHMDTLKKISN